MKKLTILMLASLIALPASAMGVTIGGYIDIGYWASQSPNFGLTVAGAPSRLQASAATNGTWSANNQFALNDVNIDVNTKFTDNITSYISWNYVNGAAGTIDYAQMDFTNLLPWGNKLTIGRFGSVIGIEQRVSEANAQKFINMSLLSPITVGSLDGLAVSGSWKTVNYQVAVSNNDAFGPGSITTAPKPPTIGTLAGALLDNNNNRSIQGRIGVVPIEGLELGVSGSSSDFAAPVGAGALIPDNKNPFRNIVAADASYVWGAFSVKGEYATVKEQQLYKNTGIPVPITMNAYYIEGWYDWTSKFGLGVRYNRAQLKQTIVGALPPGSTNADRATDYNQLSIAGRYMIADNVQFKAEYDINREPTINYANTAGRETHNDVIAASLVGSF